VQLLEPLGIPLLTAVEEFAAARAKISPHTFMEAADFFATKFVAKKEVPSTLAILDRLCAKIQDDGRDKKLYIDRLKKDGERIAAAFPDLSRATEEGFRRYLRELKTTRQVRDRTTGEMIPKGSPVGPRRRDNVRDCAVTIMRYAVEIEALPAGKTCVERISSVAFGGEVTTYEATQLAQILDYFRREDADWLPWAAIQGLAGLRTSEILRLSWAAFKWASNAIAIHAKVAKKVRVSRQAPITPALASWLNDWRHSTGPVIPRKWKDIEAAHTDALARLRKNLGWTTWGNNALRHSFGSHRVAITKSIAQVALEMGNSPQKVRENYNDPKTEDEATAYFGVFPPSWGAKIVSIRAGAAKI
jgi:integrase